MNPISSCDPSTLAGASPVSTPDTVATATGAKTDSRRQPAPGGTKTTYTLRPAATVPLPKRAAAKVKKWAKIKNKASAAYAELREIEQALLCGTGRLIEPGVIYDLPVPLRIGDKLQNALGWVDQFKTGQASKSVTINQFEPKWWIHGPKEKVAVEGGAE